MTWNRTECIEIDGKKFIAEYGSSSPVNFAQARLVDKEGKELLCNCGEKAITLVIGKESYAGICSKCIEKNA